MRRSTLCLTAVLLIVFAASAGAYDFLYTGDTAMTHEAGSFGIGGNFLYLMADSYYDEEGENQDAPEGEKSTYMWIPVDIYYSVLDQLELGIQPKFIMDKHEWGDESRAEDLEGTGIGDVWFDAKYMFMAEPVMTARVGVKIPVGTEPVDWVGKWCDESCVGLDEDGDIALGDGQMDFDGALMFGAPAGPGMFDAAVGYRYRMTQTDIEAAASRTTYDYTPGSEFHFYAGYTYYVSDMMNLTIGADGFFGSDDEEETSEESREATTLEDSARQGVWINPSFDYMMDNGMTLGASFHYPLMGTNIDAAWGFGVFAAWGS
jgi:hypothetical protein